MTTTAIDSSKLIQAVKWLREQVQTSDFWLREACIRHGLETDEATLNELVANYFYCPEIDGDCSF